MADSRGVTDVLYFNRDHTRTHRVDCRQLQYQCATRLQRRGPSLLTISKIHYTRHRRHVSLRSICDSNRESHRLERDVRKNARRRNFIFRWLPYPKILYLLDSNGAPLLFYFYKGEWGIRWYFFNVTTGKASQMYEPENVFHRARTTV